MTDEARTGRALPLAQFSAEGDDGEPGADFTGNLDAVMQIPVSVKVVLGSTQMAVAQLLKLGRGTVVPLDRRVGDPVEVVVNDHVVARGEVVVINEDGSRFGISLTEIVGSNGKPAPG